jgi:hypothetical protein
MPGSLEYSLFILIRHHSMFGMARVDAGSMEIIRFSSHRLIQKVRTSLSIEESMRSLGSLLMRSIRIQVSIAFLNS